MSEATWVDLRNRLLERYDHFVSRLAPRLGSTDLAREVVHETYLRLERTGDVGQIKNPDGYIFTTAVNIAKNRGVIDRRYLNASETRLLLDIPDDAPDPARVAEARLETELMRSALARLPRRRREIFEASWVDEVSHAELAARYGVHLRTIQREVEQATKFVRTWLTENSLPKRRG